MPKHQKKKEISEETRDTVWRAYLRGMMTETIAATFGLSPAEVEQIIEERLEEAPPLEAKSPERNIKEHFLKVQSIVDELAGVSAASKGGARIAAVRVKYEAERYLFELQRELLLVPENLGTMAVERDIPELGRQLMAWAERILTEEDQPDAFMELGDLIQFGGRGTEPHEEDEGAVENAA